MIQNASYSTGTYAKDKGTIVDAAVATPSLSTLVAAVTAADLAGTLAGDGPFTPSLPRSTRQSIR